MSAQTIYGRIDRREHGCYVFRAALNEQGTELADPVWVPEHEAAAGRVEHLGLDCLHMSSDLAVGLGLIPGRPGRKRRGVPPPETIFAFC